MNEPEQCCGGKHCPMDHNPMLWSILICTLKERQKKFMDLTIFLMKQIKFHKLENEIEIIYLSDSLFDKNKMTIGEKRNNLINTANGKYISFIDDDDMVSADYVNSIYNRLLKAPDCVSITGIMTTNGMMPKKFIHSLAYITYYEKNNIYYRCPNHLNPMLKAIALMVKFPEQSHGEDTDFALRLQKTGLLKKEEFINYPIYFYQYVQKQIYKNDINQRKRDFNIKNKI